MPYISPQARNMKVETKPLPAETDFPQLGAGGVSKPAPAGPSFAKLAEEWGKDAEEKKAIKESEKVEEEHFVLPRFNNVRNFVEQDEEKVKAPAQEWTVVQNRKFHKKKEMSLEEKFPEPDDSGEDTVWNTGPAEHETCWDERRG